MKLFITSLLFFATFLTPLNADTVRIKGHEYPKKLEALTTSWGLQGTHHFSVRLLVKISVFTGAYYEEMEGEGRRLKFTYTRDLKAKDLVAKAMEALQAQNTPEQLAQYKEKLDGIQSAYIDVKKNDSYTITAIPGKGTWLHLNGKELYSNTDGEFGLWYLNIWLGDPPIDATLKTALMGDS